MVIKHGEETFASQMDVTSYVLFDEEENREAQMLDRISGINRGSKYTVLRE